VFDVLLWQKTKTMQKEVKLKFMQGFTIFEDLAEQTLYNIIYEKSVYKKFKPK